LQIYIYIYLYIYVHRAVQAPQENVMNHSKNSHPSKTKSDAGTNGNSISLRQDPSILPRNVHTIGSNDNNNNINHHPQQQPRSTSSSSNRRRLSYPTLQRPTASLVSRIQPLSIVAGVPNEANSIVVGGIHHTSVPKMNENDVNGQHQQTAASTMRVPENIPQQHQHRNHHKASSNTNSTKTVTTAIEKNPPQKQEESQLHNFIVSLSESCRKHHQSAHTGSDHHQHFHHDDTVEIDDDPSPPSRFCIPLKNAPTYCQDAIHTLQRILPHIETTLQHEITRIADTIPNTTATITAATTTTTTTTAPSPIQPSGLHKLRILTLHMCDFYIDVLQQNGGVGFCPQAPHLLLHPQQSTYIIYVVWIGG
jgi:hypothetical protein